VLSEDRVTFNDEDQWLGPAYALGTVDELVLSEASAHFEMSSESSAYLSVTNGERDIFVRLYARPTTRAERRQILVHGGERLRDHLAALIPHQVGGRSWWSMPWWQRPAAVVREWRACVHTAKAVLIVTCEIDEELS
jgi:hypothetical protein